MCADQDTVRLPNIDSIRSSASPLNGNCPGAYFLFDGDELVYVGKSWNCLLRVAEHTRKESSKVFTSWGYYPADYDDSLLELERQLIREHRPKYNVQHNST